MKVNVKRTALIGLGFMTIMHLWAVYNWEMPKLLDGYLNELNLGKLLTGIIMSLDNLFALFMIPIMSKLSDKTSTKMGRRMPFVTVGIILSALTFALVPTTAKLGVWFLIGNVLLILVSMNVYRSPCVAFMPDITPKPLRSKANSIINICGGIGTALGYVAVLLFGAVDFYVAAGFMILALVVMLLFVRENEFVEEYRVILKENGIDESEDKTEDEEKGVRAVSNKKNVWLILAVVFLVYMANNAVETWLSLYSEEVIGSETVKILSFDLTLNTLLIIPFGVGTFAFAVPSAAVANKIGRKKTVLFGAVLMTLGYGGLIFFNGFSWFMLVLFLIGGFGFSAIIVNIYPMVVDNCDAENTGKYTGYYYTASMLAQSVTPALSGLLMSKILFDSMRVLFPYATVFMGLALLTLVMIKDDKAS